MRFQFDKKVRIVSRLSLLAMLRRCSNALAEFSYHNDGNGRNIIIFFTQRYENGTTNRNYGVFPIYFSNNEMFVVLDPIRITGGDAFIFDVLDSCPRQTYDEDTETWTDAE